ncbi:MAG: hypothetical protein AAF725_21880, partial [Acidobacteriota bacterium]
MSTTHLFVELLVIGFGALIWLALLFASVLGYDLSAASSGTLSLGTVVPILSLGYVSGILVDRLADWTFDSLWPRRHENAYREAGLDEGAEEEDGASTFYRDRRWLVLEAPRLWQFIEYGRSRLRIARGWALNWILLAATISLYSELGVSDAFVIDRCRLGMLIALLVFLACLSWRVWDRLSFQEVKKVKRQA